MERVVTRILNALGFKAKKEDSTPPPEKIAIMQRIVKQ